MRQRLLFQTIKCLSRLGKTKRSTCHLILMSTLWATVAQGNMTGTDVQLFNPSPGNITFSTVEDNFFLLPGTPQVSMWLNLGVNTLPYFDDQGINANDNERGYNDSVLGGDINFALGLMPGWQVGVAVPSTLFQSSNSNGYRGQYGDMGYTEIRVNSKVKLKDISGHKLSLSGIINLNSIKNNPYTGSSPAPSGYLGLIWSKSINKWTLGANAGRKLKPPGTQIKDENGRTPIYPQESQYIYSAAAAYQLSKNNISIISELVGSNSQKEISTISRRSSDASEIRLAALVNTKEKISWQIGAGTELNHGIATADFRIYGGVTWSPKIKKSNTPEVTIPIPDKTMVISDILFAFNSSRILRKGAKQNLGSLVEILKGPQGLRKIIIEGHTCNIGGTKYNLNLSRNRAKAIKDFLVREYKIPPQKIVARGYGESKPISTNTTARGRKMNRRVEFKIYHTRAIKTSSLK